MRVVFFHSDKDRERDLAHAFGAGVIAQGEEFEARPLGGAQDFARVDLACMVGVKSAELWRAARSAGARTLMLDKGYSRHRGPARTWEYWRISLDAHQPTGTTLLRPMPRDRLAMHPLKWRKARAGNPIIIAGSSAKYHAFMGLPDPTAYAEGLIGTLKARTRRPIIYRPKPSWRDAEPIEGVQYSPAHEALGALLAEAHALVTHGSNACLDAMLAGVPSVVLGDGVMASISSRSLDEIERPRMASKPDRVQLLANLAYHQWTEAEMAEGRAWGVIRSWL